MVPSPCLRIATRESASILPTTLSSNPTEQSGSAILTTGSRWTMRARAPQELPCNLYRLDPESGRLDVAADDFAGPNGLAFSADETLLYVADTAAMFDPDAKRHIRRFSVGEGEA